MIGLARALIHQPGLLLLDEPTSALDNDTEAFVLQLLQKIKPTCMVVLFTHHAHIARKMDRIYVIEHNTIGKKGIHDELLLTENLYSRSWHKLFE
jgi:ATP-binding cassette, subfamily C, bacteriocin exporter